MTPTPSRPLSTAVRTPRPAPSFRARLRATTAAVAALVVVGALAVAAVSVSGAAPGPAGHDHAANVPVGVPLASDEPALPTADVEVGVLDVFGNPLLDLDGEPLQVPLPDLAPTRLPPDAAQPPAVDDPPTEGTVEVGLFEATVATLDQVATDQGYTLVERFDLLRLNGMLVDAEGQPGGLDAFRALLATFEYEVPRGNRHAACATATTALEQSDGVPVDLIAGAGVGALRAELLARRAELPCPS